MQTAEPTHEVILSGISDVTVFTPSALVAQVEGCVKKVHRSHNAGAQRVAVISILKPPTDEFIRGQRGDRSTISTEAVLYLVNEINPKDLRVSRSWLMEITFSILIVQNRTVVID